MASATPLPQLLPCDEHWPAAGFPVVGLLDGSIQLAASRGFERLPSDGTTRPGVLGREFLHPLHLIRLQAAEYQLEPPELVKSSLFHQLGLTISTPAAKPLHFVTGFLF
jgi:hypothetical protein